MRYYFKTKRSLLLQLRCTYKLLTNKVAPIPVVESSVKEYAVINSQLPHEIVIILYWTPYWEVNNWLGSGVITIGKKGGQSCYFTASRDMLDVAHYVVFHAVDICDWPDRRAAYQRWIVFSHEPPTFYNYDIDKINLYRNLFDFTASYRSDSDIMQSYGRCYKHKITPRSFFLSHDMFELKTRNVAWFVSECITHSKRENYVSELQKHIDVDIYGRCSNLKCPTDSWGYCYQMLNQTYKFYLSFENSLCVDYITEKVYGLLADSINVIPVVYGGANYTRFLPPHSFIDARLFASPKQLAHYLLYVSQNEAEFTSYFKWRTKFTCRFQHTDSELFCKRSIELLNVTRPNVDVGSIFNISGSCLTP